MSLLNKYLKIKLQLIIAALFLFKNTFTQTIIQNGSFESYNAPVNWNHWGGGFFDYSVNPFQRILQNWDGIATPDFFTSACTHTYSGVPLNLFGTNIAKNGTNYVGFALYQKGSEAKEYIYQQLSAPLQSGKVYCVSFYVSRGERSTYAIKNIEVCFSNTVLPMPNGYYINTTPQIMKQVAFVTDTANWINIQGCFTALGGEKYITIGNFNSNTNTDTLYIGTNNPIPSYGDFSYYYIDDISLVEDLSSGLVSSSATENRFNVYPNPTSGNLKIVINNFKEEPLSIKITDILGKETLQEKYKEEIDLSFLENGIYFLSLYKNNQLLSTKKIVKN